ncbi:MULTISPECIES: hypothetical protein [Burkholderia]|uniref:hypothetical protein n=1 Tax=Burkholderia TaxID=32008 RepID=UPI000B0781D4|nr:MULTISPECIES: hypothetical protein [Burkholderia]EKS9887811.1 hypothetical protein [Burkholderia pyrrocinia]EKS9892520.1 hypothetical protein [Burkholderia pyrrocinia]EKS9910060.1 hypothetical protein [Burkholderia pyrrocinia]UOB57585.1 hypothetical protein MRS60_25665 [Burkholderia pyrrocinia]HDR9507053.1 hypothetical protein [Burkholderia cepacia]
MSFILALLQKIDDLFVSPHLPLDAEYSYAARHVEAERVRRAHLVPIVLYRR